MMDNSDNIYNYFSRDNYMMNKCRFNLKIKEYIVKSHTTMFIFDVKRPCGESNLVFLYKAETLTDLYNKIGWHFNTKFHELCIMNLNYESQVIIPSSQTIQEFMAQFIENNNFTPNYTRKTPMIYSLQLHDTCNCYFCKPELSCKEPHCTELYYDSLSDEDFFI